MPITTINPSTGQPIRSYPEMSAEEIQKIINLTHEDFKQWRKISFAERGELMHRMAELLQQEKQCHAELMTTEMGKPIKASIAEIEKCAMTCDYYAKNAEKLLSPEIIPTESKKSYVIYQPTGIIFAIMPWNFPMWQVFRFAVPNLMVGHGCLLKHAPIVTGTALAIEALFRKAGFPEHIFRTLVMNTDFTSSVIANPHITGVTLTGSERAGRSVAELAGKHLKKIVLELGGSDPYIVLEDADLTLAANTCLTSRLSNSGQVCIAAKRLIIVDAIFSDFQKKILEKISDYTIGPLARADLRDNVHRQVQKSLKEGAQLLCGGELPSGPGFYYPITVLSEVTSEMTAFNEEVFGPVIALIRAKNTAHAIELANQTRYGLGAAIFSQNVAKAEKIAAEELEAGTCVVNGLVKSDPRLPFGGTKNSGFGRELGVEGLREFTNMKTVTVF